MKTNCGTNLGIMFEKYEKMDTPSISGIPGTGIKLF